MLPSSFPRDLRARTPHAKVRSLSVSLCLSLSLSVSVSLSASLCGLSSSSGPRPRHPPPCSSGLRGGPRRARADGVASGQGNRRAPPPLSNRNAAQTFGKRARRRCVSRWACARRVVPSSVRASLSRKTGRAKARKVSCSLERVLQLPSGPRLSLSLSLSRSVKEELEREGRSLFFRCCERAGEVG